MIFVTGGLGFIGGNLIKKLLSSYDLSIVNLDACTYAANPAFSELFSDKKNYFFHEINICDFQPLLDLFHKYQPSAVIHLAAESHVDNSIKNPLKFIETNINGTFSLLEASRRYRDESGRNLKFLHVSTDEVFGSLKLDDPPFKESNPFKPNSPYSASKASSDHLVRAYYKTYNLDCLITNCSNNYGPYQNKEKLIPKIIFNALNWHKIPVYGDGKQIRDWLFVEDHCEALIRALNDGVPGQTYNIGGNNEVKNIDTINLVCNLLDEMKLSKNGSYSKLIEFVTDRPGHDTRYAIDSSKANKDLSWTPKESFVTGMTKTIEWYLNN